MCNVIGICLSPERCGGDDKCENTTEGYTVTMVFNVSFSKINDSIAEFKGKLHQSLWNVTNSSCIRNFSVESGSIIVTFTMTPQKGQSTDDLIKTIAKLEAAVKSGNFRVALPSGEVITADANSFKATRITPTAPPPTTVATTTESSSNKTTIIIVCSVIGGLLLIVIIILVVYCCMKKKKQQRVSPNSSRAKLQEEVPMKDHPGNFFFRLLHVLHVEGFLATQRQKHRWHQLPPDIYKSTARPATWISVLLLKIQIKRMGFCFISNGFSCHCLCGFVSSCFHGNTTLCSLLIFCLSLVLHKKFNCLNVRHAKELS